MAKPKSPLLSLGARGTIGDALTYQKRGQDTIVRQKPIPRDPYSLNQAYQRWDYRDYAYQWTLLSDSEKQVYRTKASKYHITGFSQWMRENLKTLPDLAGRWHFDEKGGATAYDSSKQGNNGTIFGATPISGPIDGAFYFDGLNDYIRVPGSTSLHPVEQISIEFFATPRVSATIWNFIVSSFGDLYSVALHTPLKRMYFTAGGVTINGPNNSFALDTLQHFAVTFDSTLPAFNVAFFVEGSYVGGWHNPNPMSPLPNYLEFGTHWHHPNNYDHKGLLDHLSIYNGILDPTTVKRHSERRYPA